MHKKWVILSTATLLIIVSFLSAKYFYFQNLYDAPYIIVQEMVEAIDTGEKLDNVIVTAQEWDEITEDSIFSQVRRELKWNEFEEFVEGCQEPQFSLFVENGRDARPIMHHVIQNDHRIVPVLCMEYDEPNGKQIGLSHITIYMQLINEEWKIVGRSLIF